MLETFGIRAGAALRARHDLRRPYAAPLGPSKPVMKLSRDLLFRGAGVGSARLSQDAHGAVWLTESQNPQLCCAAIEPAGTSALSPAAWSDITGLPGPA